MEITRIWVRQKFSGDTKPWHILADDGRSLYCMGCVKVKTRRTTYAKQPSEGKVCLRCLGSIKSEVKQ